MKKIILVIALSTSCFFAYARSFIVGGIAYTPISDTEVAVTPIEGFSYYGKIVIPETVQHEDINYSVTQIGEAAFYECFCLTDVTLPKTIVKIRDYAFYRCPNLKTVVLPESLQIMGGGAFFACTKITKVVIPNNVEIVPECCYEGCTALASITLGKSVSIIRKRAFADCSSLTAIKIPASVTAIKDGAFKDCKKLSTVTFENKQNVTIDGRNAFANSPYGNANSQNSVRNDSRFKVRNSVTF